MKVNTRHGGPYDRGLADKWYSRPEDPHFYVGNTGTSRKITDLSDDEIREYKAGYQNGVGKYD